MSDVKKMTRVFTARMTWNKDSIPGLPDSKFQALIYYVTSTFPLFSIVTHLFVVSWPCTGISGPETSVPHASLSGVSLCLDLELIPHLLLYELQSVCQAC